jgi:hypothetical protein
MRFILVSAVIGIAVGAALAYVEVQPTVNGPQPHIAAATNKSEPASDSSGPRVEVDNPTYNFGTMQRGTQMTHEFVVRNVGTAPLTLNVVSTSCKCTVGDVSGDPIPPGESVPVKLEWRALTGVGSFRQTAYIETNDPRQSRVMLSVDGQVAEASGVAPPDFVFGRVSAGTEKSADVYVMALAQEELEVHDPELSYEETRKFFDVQIEPVDRASLPDPNAKQGVRIRLTAKPGLPLGHFDQYLSIATNIPDAKNLVIPIVGRVVGGISVYGSLWSENRGVLRLGNVSSEEGASSTLNLVIRGAGADEVSLEVTATDPPELNAKLGEPKQLKPTLVHVPLTVEVPPGTRPMVRLETDHSDGARIVLKTTHPDAPEMVLRVEFTVER